MKPYATVHATRPLKPKTRQALENAATAAVLALSETQIEDTITKFLEWDGWRALRTNPVSDRGRGKGFGEPGMADHLYIRYWNDGDPRKGRYPTERPGRVYSPVADVMWIEFKRLRPSKRGPAWGRATKLAIHQSAWHALERSRGALTLKVGEDCPATIEGIKAWYFESGLARRIQPSTPYP